MVLQEYQIPEGRSTTPSKPNVGIVEKTNHHSTFFNQQPKNVFEIEGNLDHDSLHEKSKKNRLLQLTTTIVTIQYSVSKQQSRSLSLFSYPPLSLLC